MSSIIRCYLDAGQPLYEQFEQYLTQRYPDRQIDIRFEQELAIGASRLLTFLVTLPDVKRGKEAEYQHRIFLSALPILVPSIIYLEHVRGYDEPIKESSQEQVREWLNMSESGRLFKRQLSHQAGRRTGPDVPLISGNMREE